MNVAMLTIVATLAAIPVAYVAIRIAMLPLKARPHAAPCVRATLAFLRAISPVVGALLVAVGIVLPAFVRFEPPHDGEEVGFLLLLLAALGAVQILCVAFRLVRILHVSRTITTGWRQRARTLSRSDWGLPALAIDSGFPVVAVSGFLRPTLFVDSSVLESCSSSELAAIAAHERAHVRRWDNLRRLLIGACAGPRSAAAAAWREAAEHAADRSAASTPSRALDLASALLKVARLAPVRSFEATALSTILDGDALETRVRRLIASDHEAPNTRVLQVAAGASISVAVVMALTWNTLLSSTHAVIETAVKSLR
jgi:beta-lactamase regulating signal transducer with metallopeptidase domain